MEYQTSLAKKLTTRNNPKTIYDGVFSSSPQQSRNSVNDYKDIFLGSANKDSSIPFLDVPALTKTTSFDSNKNNSHVDYSQVFGGFKDFDGASLSYEDIVAANKPAQKKHSFSSSNLSMELKPMNMGESAKIVGTKQFNMPYRKMSPGLSNGGDAMHIAELNAVSGFTYLVDEGSGKPTAKDGFCDGGSREEMSRVERVDGNKRSRNTSSLFDSCKINYKEDFTKGSCSNFETGLGVGRDEFEKPTISKQGMPRTEKTKGSFSPPNLDEGIDENSVAAASAAALKLAIAKAQARIKMAKESKEKKAGLQSFKDGFRSDERKESRVTKNASGSCEDKAQKISGKANSWMQGFSGLGNQTTTKARQEGPGSGDSFKIPDMKGPTREASVQKIRSTPVEHRRCSTEKQEAERLPELSSVRFEQADNAKRLVQSPTEFVRKEVKMTEKETQKPAEYGKKSNLVEKVCLDENHECGHNVSDTEVGQGFIDSLKVADVEGPTREEAPMQRIRSPPDERSRCRAEKQEAEKFSEVSTARFEEADNVMQMMHSNESLRKEVKLTEKQKEKPVEYDNESFVKVCTDEKSESEDNLFYDAEEGQVHEDMLNTSKEQINLENKRMTVEVTTEQEETAKKPPKTYSEEECCEKTHMVNQPIKAEKKYEHQEVKEIERTEVIEPPKQIESMTGEEVDFEQIESKNHLDDFAEKEGNEIVLKETCGLNSWEEITEGPHQRKSETLLVFEGVGENYHIDAPWRSYAMERFDLVHGKQIMAGKYGDFHVMKQIDNIKPAVDRGSAEEKESGNMIQQICQLKDNRKTKAVTKRLVETDRIQTDINLKSSDEVSEEACPYDCKQDNVDDSKEVQAAAQRWGEAGVIHADDDLEPGDEATQEVCLNKQNEQERNDDDINSISMQDHGKKSSEIQGSYMPTEINGYVEVIPEVLARENNEKVMEVSETSDEPIVKTCESKSVEQIKEIEEENEPKRAGSATEFKDQTDGISETELDRGQQEQCKEDSVLSNLGCESGERNSSDEDVEVSIRHEEEQSPCEERLVDHGQCMEAAQLPCKSKEKLEATITNEETNYDEIQGKKKENKILEEAADAFRKEKVLEKKRPIEKEEAKKMEREKEKQRIAVERAMREARERAFAEARRKMSEARERPEKPPAGTNERSSADKAKLKAERVAVERATAEARERALKKALSEKAGMGVRKQANVNEMRRTFSSTDSQHNRPVSSSSSRYPDPSNHGVPSSSEKLDGVDGESAQRCKARLERHQRTAERAAKALTEKNTRDLLALKEQQERNRLAEALDADIKRWSSGKEKNLRALLSTLQYILGPDSCWQPISLTDLVTSAAVKKAYRKSTLFVHPDKLQQRGASIQQKYICEKVFDLLQDAWNRFSAEER